MKKIAVQGLGYVGLAMMTFCAGAKRNNKYLYNVVGIEKKSPKGLKILKKINSNQNPKIVDDKKQIEEWVAIYRKMQINLTGFVNGKNARLFMGELWALLASAQATESGK